MEFTAQWIRANNMPADVVPVFKKDFSCHHNVQKAMLYITALGVYEANINGKRVGQYIMAPGWTVYHHRVQYQTYDVTDMLQEENTICAYVGKGWYSAPIGLGKEAEEARRQRPNGLLAELHLCYADGTLEVVKTDTSWQCAESAIRYSELYNGEHYDAGFAPSEWYAAEILPHPTDVLVPQEGEEVRELGRVMAKEILMTPKGEIVVDFGQELTGYVEFSVNARQGQSVKILHGEVLDKDGNFYNQNYRNAKAELEYICKDGENVYHSRLTFFGFRYIKLEQWPQEFSQIDIRQFCGIVVASEIKKTGCLQSSDPVLNQFFSNVLWGQKCNFLDVPTDCPQRDERLGWTGDAQVFCKAASYNYDVNRFFEKWLKDLYLAQMDTAGAVPYIVPNILWKEQLGSAAWGDAATIIPWQMYMTYGNRTVLENQWDSMVQWVRFIGRNTITPYLWIGGRHFGDWLALDNGDGVYEGRSNKDFIASAFYAHSVSLLIETGKVLDRDVTEFEALYHSIVAKFREEFSEYHTQTECVLALQFGLTPNPDETAAKLAELLQEAGRMETGFVGTPYILHTLSDNGYTELAYELLLRREYPSWLYSVTKGATTVWEHWDSIRENGDFWSVDMNSFNHYAYGSVVDWVYEKAAGILPAKPGFSRITVAPHPTKKLKWLEASVQTVNGPVSSRWTNTDQGIRYDITIPVAGTVVIAGKAHSLPAGEYVFWS